MLFCIRKLHLTIMTILLKLAHGLNQISCDYRLKVVKVK